MAFKGLFKQLLIVLFCLLSSISAEAKDELHLQLGHGGWINSLAITKNGEWLLSGSSDHNIKLWQVRTSREVRSFKAHSGAVMGVSIAPDNLHFISASEDKTLFLWRLDKSYPLKEFKGHLMGVTAVKFLNNHQFISASHDRTLRLWDIKTGQSLKIFIGHQKSILNLALSPDKKQILSGTGGGEIKLWDIESGIEIRSFEGSKNQVNGLAFSPDGSEFVSVGSDRNIRRWNVITGRLIKEWPGHFGWTNSVQYFSDGQRILTGSGFDKRLVIWNLQGKRLKQFIGHPRGVRSVLIHPDEEQVFSGSIDQTVRSWNLNGSKTILNSAYQPIHYGDRLSENELVLHTGSRVLIWNIREGKPIKYLPLAIPYNTPIATSSNYLMTTNAQHQIMRWNVIDSRFEDSWNGHDKKITHLLIDEKQELLFSVGRDNQIKIWQISDGKLLRVLKGHKDKIMTVAGNHKYLLSSDSDKNSYQWRVNSGVILRDLSDNTARIQELALSDKFILSGYDSGRVEIRKSQIGQIVKVLQAHKDSINALSFDPFDASLFYTAGADQMIYSWELEKGKPQYSFVGHEGNLKQIIPFNHGIATISEDRTLRFWNKKGKFVYGVVFKSDGFLSWSSDDQLKSNFSPSILRGVTLVNDLNLLPVDKIKKRTSQQLFFQ